jgi:Probable Zinc-ribbon domain
VLLAGRNVDAHGRFEKTRYRCAPSDRNEKGHVFLAPLALRREVKTGHECENCERVFKRAEGIATGWRFAFSVRDAADALVRAGIGGYDNSYRKIGRALRGVAGRNSVRGKHAGSVPRGAQLASDYLDAFAGIVNAAVAPSEWPPIIAIDDKPVYKADHSLCCKPYRDRGERAPRHDSWGPPADETGADDAESGTGQPTSRRPKIAHDAPMLEVGRILVAVGYESPQAKPRPWLVRYAGGRDEVSWTEFLESLPGQPEWVVSDRDGAISNAVHNAFPAATHYFCEQHLAQNAAAVAREKDDIRTKAARMGIPETWHQIWPILESAQFDPDHWTAAIEAAKTWNLPETGRWLTENTPLIEEQWRKRRPFFPRSAGACESVINAVWAAMGERAAFFRNADRLNLLLGLVRNNLDLAASIPAYSKVLRSAFTIAEGKANPDWAAIRDPAGQSSILLLYADAQERAKAAKARRSAPGKSANYRARRVAYEQERMVLGLPPSPRGRPRILRAQGSVAGKTIADFPWLVAEWHPTANGEIAPADVPAGSGILIWWKCPVAPDHEWACQVRSRTLRGSGCRFCAHKAIAKSESLSVTHPDIAAQWHLTRNRKKQPSDFTYGSRYEAWWQCPRFKSHVWRARISSRTAQITGCSLCGGGRPRADAIEASKSA